MYINFCLFSAFIKHYKIQQATIWCFLSLVSKLYYIHMYACMYVFICSVIALSRRVEEFLSMFCFLRYCVEKRSRLCLYAVVSSICSYINRIVHRQRWSPNKYWNQWKRFRADNSRRAQTIHSRQNSANALLEQIFTTVTGAQAYSHICIYIYVCICRPIHIYIHKFILYVCTYV